jgi:uncharacterized protein (TIGR02145 family)
MKNYFKKLALLFTVVILLIVSCSKDDKTNPTENPLTTEIITPAGGDIETNEGIKITFPANSVSVDTEVAIGYSGTEPTTFPNPNVQILGKAFTVKIDTNTLNESAVLEIPKPTGFTNTDETIVLISKEGSNTYYPLYFNESGDKLVAELDDINYQDLYPSLRSSAKANSLGTILFVYIIKYLQTPPAIEMGLKKVDVSVGNTLTFTDVPIIGSSDKVLIMVHGWISSPSSAWKGFLTKIKPKIECAGYTQYLTFGYNSSLSIDENSILLANLLQTKMNGATVDIVGHSMGGLVTRSAIENHGCSGIVRNLITLGTPHLGSVAANLRTFLGISLSSSYEGSNYSVNTQGFRDLIPSSVFLTNLNDNPAPTTNYYPIGALFNNILEFDGVVTKISALGIQNNANLTIGNTYVVPGPIPHQEMTNNDDPIILRVAEKLNLYNNAPQSCGECEDTSASYPTVTIGGQVWMQKNLNVCKYRNGDDIPQVQDPTQFFSLTTGAWCYYNNDTANGPVYGKLYNCYAVKDPRGLAPTGYHVPSVTEWDTLSTYLGGVSVAGGKMKSTTGDWNSPNTNATNSSGFTALPAGYCGTTFGGLGFGATFWTSTQGGTSSAWARSIIHSDGYLRTGYNADSMRYGYSVRCVRD